MKGQSILSLILATAPQTSVGVLARNEARLTGRDIVKLIGGLSDSVTLRGVETHDKRFDVSSASALHNLLWVQRDRRFIADFEGRAAEILKGRTEKNLASEDCLVM